MYIPDRFVINFDTLQPAKKWIVDSVLHQNILYDFPRIEMVCAELNEKWHDELTRQSLQKLQTEFTKIKQALEESKDPKKKSFLSL